MKLNLSTSAPTVEMLAYAEDMLVLKSTSPMASRQLFYDPDGIFGQIVSWLDLVESRWGSPFICGGLPPLYINGNIKVCELKLVLTNK